VDPHPSAGKLGAFTEYMAFGSDPPSTAIFEDTNKLGPALKPSTQGSKTLKEAEAEVATRDAFAKFDLSKDRFLQKGEAINFLASELGLPKVDGRGERNTTLDTLFLILDVNDDGKLSERELVQAVADRRLPGINHSRLVYPGSKVAGVFRKKSTSKRVGGTPIRWRWSKVQVYPGLDRFREILKGLGADVERPGSSHHSLSDSVLRKTKHPAVKLDYDRVVIHRLDKGTSPQLEATWGEGDPLP